MPSDSDDLWRARLSRREHPAAPRVTPPSGSPAMLGYAIGANQLNPAKITGPEVEGGTATITVDATATVGVFRLPKSTVAAGDLVIAHYVPHAWVVGDGCTLYPATIRTWNGCFGFAPGVLVTLKQGDRSYTGTTGADGTVSIDPWGDSDPGDFDLTIKFPNSSAETRTVSLDGSDFLEIKSLLTPARTLYLTDPGGTVPIVFNVAHIYSHVPTQGYHCRFDHTDPGSGIDVYVMDADLSTIACPTSYLLFCVSGTNTLRLDANYVSRDGSITPAVSDQGDTAGTSISCPLFSTEVLFDPIDLTGIDLTGPFVLTFLATGTGAAALYGGDTLITLSSSAP